MALALSLGQKICIMLFGLEQANFIAVASTDTDFLNLDVYLFTNFVNLCSRLQYQDENQSLNLIMFGVPMWFKLSQSN